MHSAQPSQGDRGVRGVLGGRDEVGKNGSGVHRHKLIGIADKDEPCRRSHGLEQAGHVREGDHARLVDEDHVVREAIAPVVTKPRARVRIPAEESMQGGRLHVADRRNHGTGRVLGGAAEDAGQGFGHGSPDARRGLAGRRGQPDMEGALTRGGRLLGEQSQHAGDGGRLPGPRPARDDARPRVD